MQAVSNVFLFISIKYAPLHLKKHYNVRKIIENKIDKKSSRKEKDDKKKDHDFIKELARSPLIIWC